MFFDVIDSLFFFPNSLFYFLGPNDPGPVLLFSRTVPLSLPLHLTTKESFTENNRVSAVTKMVALFGKKKRQEEVEAKKATATAALKAERRLSLKQAISTATKQIIDQEVPTPLRQQVLAEPDHAHASSSMSDSDESLDYSTSQNTNKSKARKSPVQSQPTNSKKSAVRRGSLSNVQISEYSHDNSALLQHLQTRSQSRRASLRKISMSSRSLNCKKPKRRGSEDLVTLLSVSRKVCCLVRLIVLSEPSSQWMVRRVIILKYLFSH